MTMTTTRTRLPCKFFLGSIAVLLFALPCDGEFVSTNHLRGIATPNKNSLVHTATVLRGLEDGDSTGNNDLSSLKTDLDGRMEGSKNKHNEGQGNDRDKDVELDNVQNGNDDSEGENEEALSSTLASISTNLRTSNEGTDGKDTVEDVSASESVSENSHVSKDESESLSVSESDSNGDDEYLSASDVSAMESEESNPEDDESESLSVLQLEVEKSNSEEGESESLSASEANGEESDSEDKESESLLVSKPGSEKSDDGEDESESETLALVQPNSFDLEDREPIPDDNGEINEKREPIRQEDSPAVPNNNSDEHKGADHVGYDTDVQDNLDDLEEGEVKEEEKIVDEVKEELDVKKEQVRVFGGVGILFAVAGMIFTAYQVSDNPDGFVASICRLAITLCGCVVKIFLMPFRKFLGVHAPQYAGHAPVSTMDYSETYRTNAGVELS